MMTQARVGDDTGRQPLVAGFWFILVGKEA